MSSTRRSRANSENLAAASVRHGHTVPEVFQRYTLPTQNNGRLEIRFLGVAALDLCSAAFYQVSETAPPRQQQQQQLEEDDTAESFVYLVSTDLPPKKRRRERVLRHDVIFCLNPPADASVPDPDLAYYIFPHDAVVEAVNEASPLEILFSFHTHAFAEDDSEPQKYMRRRSTDRGSLVFRRSSFDSSSRNVVSMRITGASRGLFLSIKQTVSGFETICRKMMQLMRRHSEQLADQRSLEIMHSNNQRQHAAAPPPPPEWDTQTTTSTVSVLDHTHHKNGHLLDTDEMVLDKEATNASNDIPDERSTLPSLASSAPAGLCGSNTGKSQVRTTTSNGGGGGSSTSSSSSIRKCLYCGSKSTPMWRRGPQGAGTLCNACGVKWKHGKILNGNNGGTVESPRERTIKTERRRKKASGSYNSQRASERRVSRSITHNQKSKMTTDDDMESAAQSLSLHEDDSEFTKHHQQQQQQQQSRDVIEPHSFSSSISGSYSPLESSPSSSPLLSAHDNLIEKFGLNDTSFPLSDAVEAATVLTLLKRS